MKRKQDPRREELRALPLFSTLPDRTLDALAEAGRDVHHLAGQTIIKEGGIGVGFHIVVSGRLDVTAEGAKVGEVREGEFFGEIALLEGIPRSATVTAATDVRTFSIDPSQFRWLLEKHPEVRERIDKVIADRRAR